VQRGTQDLVFAAYYLRQPTACAAGHCRTMEMVFIGQYPELHRKRRYTLAELG
jgi:hypothetical protein